MSEARGGEGRDHYTYTPVLLLCWTFSFVMEVEWGGEKERSRSRKGGREGG